MQSSEHTHQPRRGVHQRVNAEPVLHVCSRKKSNVTHTYSWSVWVGVSDSHRLGIINVSEFSCAMRVNVVLLAHEMRG